MSMTCPFCRAAIPDDSWFCDQCGKELHFCPECRKPKQGTLCAACGSDLVGAKLFFNPQTAVPSAGVPKALFLTAPGMKIELHEGVFGRTQGVYPEFSTDRYVSGRHGEFRFNGGKWQICDLGSTNGTFIGGQRLETGKWADLTPEMEVKIAVTTYKLSL